jgi:hypothetical protein
MYGIFVDKEVGGIGKHLKKVAKACKGEFNGPVTATCV